MLALRILALLLAATSLAAQAADADHIWTGGTILTMNDAAMRAEAVAVKDGRILAAGTAASVMAHRGPATAVVDLGGRALLPGFVDSHGHVFMGGLQALSANLLAPPDADVVDVASLQRQVREWMVANEAIVRQIDLVIGFGYDNAQLAELRHPTRDDLDAVSATVPIILIHQSGHIGALNSKALQLAGVLMAAKNPPGGVIRRRADGAPDGVLEETAFFSALLKLIPRIGDNGAKAMVRAGADLWARFGYTTAQEGRTTPAADGILRAVADEGGLAIDVVAYSDVLGDRDYIVRNVTQDYRNRYRLGGAKLTIDGSPQGFTAWRDRPYYAPVGDYPPGYVGYAAVTREQVLDAVAWAYHAGVQLLTHSNGEAATDLLVAAHDAARGKAAPAGRRDVLIHGQFLREDQVAALDRLGLFPSIFPMHTFYWGDWHRDHTVGPVNAENISPSGWVRARGMMFGTHHDAPVAFPDSMRVLDATVTRRTRSGDILGPAQRVDVITALKAMTIWPAWQHFEEARKGSIEPGKLADFVVLSADPTAVDPETLDGLQVLETIKEGRTVFTRDAAVARILPGGTALPNLLAALGGPAARPVFGTVAAAMADAPAAATCMSDGILAFTTAMLDPRQADRVAGR
jgi:predicted amidohydrolase YtcJ